MADCGNRLVESCAHTGIQTVGVLFMNNARAIKTNLSFSLWHEAPLTQRYASRWVHRPPELIAGG